MNGKQMVVEVMNEPSLSGWIMSIGSAVIAGLIILWVQSRKKSKKED